ncbi:MAG TPA: ATP-binding cassette domain-containing protein [Thermoanaerobaculia bacterium]|nr:ATP-binding cassette domain-containing protein [Thermoanaerobaculia bacterium]
MGSSVFIDRATVAGSNGNDIVRDVSLRIDPGESVAVIGRSGAGKTTLLRLLNGLAVPRSGSVVIDGSILGASGLAKRRRRIGTILQAPALFPHRTVFENVATVPRLFGWTDERIRRESAAILQRLDLPFDRFADRFPRSLSGGEQQRVGIARAMVADPPLLLCDEPFSALDPIVRRDLQDTFVALRDGGSVTLLFVTHDVAEALRVARRIVLIDGGAIVADLPAGDFVRSAHPLIHRFLDAARIPEAS